MSCSGGVGVVLVGCVTKTASGMCFCSESWPSSGTPTTAVKAVTTVRATINYPNSNSNSESNKQQ